MGSVVVSDLVSTTRFPYTMLAGTAARSQLPTADPVYHSSQGPSSSAHTPVRGAPSLVAPGVTEPRPAATSQASQDASHHSLTTSSNYAIRGRSNSQPVRASSSSSGSPRQTGPTQQHLPNPPLFEASHAPAPSPYEQFSVPLQSSSPTGTASSNTSSTHTIVAHHSSSSTQRAACSSNCIRVRDLSHIQQLASEDHLLGGSASKQRSRGDADDVGIKYEISAMPVADIIEMVSGLLAKITATNDQQHEHLHENIPPPEGTAGLSPQSSSILAFHGKNVPTITVLSYLTRIHRYCPTTYEVFLGLLVYFDRMTERVNSGSVLSLRQASGRDGTADATRGTEVKPSFLSVGQGGSEKAVSRSYSTVTPPSLASDEGTERLDTAMSPVGPGFSPSVDPFHLSQFFVVDSFNIHRLVIAGVTCASKFFSDVFYTNSRYAKVGGLPLVELNHLEIQFLILNDFRLFVPVEELEAYGTMLVEFYVREVINQRQSHLLDDSGLAIGGVRSP